MDIIFIVFPAEENTLLPHSVRLLVKFGTKSVQKHDITFITQKRFANPNLVYIRRVINKSPN